MSDDQLFPVPAEWAKKAWVDNAGYLAMYEASVKAPAAFWADKQ